VKVSIQSSGDQSGRKRRIASWIAGIALAIGGLAGASAPGSTALAGCDALAVPTIGIERCVVAGDQAEIDAGHVVRIDRLSTPTVHWLAGHRTSHGATFRALVGLRIGDPVEYRGKRYEIVEYTIAPFTNPGRVLAWSRATEPTLVLQTSRDSYSAHLWRAVAVGAPTAAPFVQIERPQPQLFKVAVPGAAGADAVVLNLTAVNPAGPGFLTAYSCDTTRPTTSNLNYANPTTVQANLVIVHPDPDGNICIYSSQTTDLVIDTIGTFPANSNYNPTTPTRLTDTRNHGVR
jgi:Sortase domain